jgi:glyoxylase-like metal-dependent hydrolase (beta-lactamase superfamily II)
MKIIAVDCKYVDSEFAAAWLLIHQGRGLFIECNTNNAIPYLKAAALNEGLTPEKIDGLIITHVHLDHAGGAGLFLREFPNARLYAHPRAARHAIDPSKLIASATHVYGTEFMSRLYGEVLPCDASRVTSLEDGQAVEFSGIRLETRHVRGHANHHLVVMEPLSRTLFSGDSFGVSYPRIHQSHGLVVIPSTSPTDFDPIAAIETVKWVMGQAFHQVALTHFGLMKAPEIPEAGKQLLDQLEFSQTLLKRIKEEKLEEERILELLVQWNRNYFEARGIRFSTEDWALLHIDLKVNAQGLRFAALK